MTQPWKRCYSPTFDAADGSSRRSTASARELTTRVCQRGRLLEARPGLGGFRLNQDRAHTKPMAGLDVRDRIADHHAVAGVAAGKIAEGPLEHAWKRLAAIALAFVMHAAVDSVELRAVLPQVVLQVPVQRGYIGFAEQAQRHTTLVGNQDDLASAAIQASDHGLGKGK